MFKNEHFCFHPVFHKKWLFLLMASTISLKNDTGSSNRISLSSMIAELKCSPKQNAQCISGLKKGKL